MKGELKMIVRNEVVVELNNDEVKEIITNYIKTQVKDVTSLVITTSSGVPLQLGIKAVCSCKKDHIVADEQSKTYVSNAPSNLAWENLFGGTPMSTDKVKPATVAPVKKAVQLKHLNLMQTFTYLKRDFIVEGILGDRRLCRQLGKDTKHKYSENNYVIPK